MRNASIERRTSETDVSISIELDGKGTSNIDTGIGFFDHMLTLFSRHGKFDFTCKCVGDIQVDYHHTVEDIGIVLGQAIASASGDKRGITRYGNMMLPMDEALALVSIDLSGRPYLVYDVPDGQAGGMELQLFEEFFRAVSINAGMTLHIKVLYGNNHHHIIEGVFKGFARALAQALSLDARETGIPSTKGVL